MVLDALGRLEAQLVLESRHGGGFVEKQRRAALAEWLSDWHLLAYCPQIGFFNEVGATRIAFG
jgi:DNA-binding FadR family transcriptional regulator